MNDKNDLISGIQIIVFFLFLLVMGIINAILKNDATSHSEVHSIMWESRWCWFGIYIPAALSILILQCVKIKVDPSPEIITSMQIMLWIVFPIAFVYFSCKWGWLVALPILVAHIITQVFLKELKRVSYSGSSHSSSGYYSSE